MRTILAIAALFAVSACQSGGGYDPGPPVMYGPSPFQVWTPPPPQYRQPLTCGRVGTMVHCY
jgi:hypothetical protein